MTKIHAALFHRSTAALLGILTFGAALVTGMHYVSRAFASTQPGSPDWLHVLSAGAVEVGVIFVGLTLAIRSAEGDRNWRLYGAVLLFVAVSAVANFDSAASAILGGPLTWPALVALDRWTLAKAGLLGAAVPAMVLVSLEALRELAASGAPVAKLPGRRSGSRLPSASAPAETFADDDDEEGERGSPAELVALVESDPSLNVNALADLLNVSRGTVYAWARREGLERDEEGEWMV